MPPNCRTDYPKYNGTGDPASHIMTFRSCTRAYVDDQPLLAYLFQFTLEGDPLRWYYTLEPKSIETFESVKGKFLERYQHCTAYIPTITDLVKEKMKPDEELVMFIQRWRAVAARSICTLSEPEQIQMIVANTLPHIHSWFSITGCPSTFAQLYQRGTDVQATLKDPSFQLYASRSKVGKRDQGPTTEGVTINEQIGLVNQRSNLNHVPTRPNPPKQAYNQALHQTITHSVEDLEGLNIHLFWRNLVISLDSF